MNSLPRAVGLTVIYVMPARKEDVHDACGNGDERVESAGNPARVSGLGNRFPRIARLGFSDTLLANSL